MKDKVLDFLIITLATIGTGAAVFFFLLPSHVSVGSISALAMVVSNFIPLQVSTITMIMNKTGTSKRSEFAPYIF